MHINQTTNSMNTPLTESQTFLNVQLRGVTRQMIVWLVVSTVTICSSIMGTYFSMMGKIEHNTEVNNSQDVNIRDLQEDAKVRNLQINALQIQYNVLEARVNDLERMQNKTK